MSTIFTISCSWHESQWLFEPLAFASGGDAIVLLQDAVLAAHSPITLGSFVAKCLANEVAVSVLSDDMLLRGVTNKYVDIDKIDYLGFVRLVEQHDKQVAW